jgi:hypothetical protein
MGLLGCGRLQREQLRVGRTCALTRRQKKLEQYEHLDRSAYWRCRRSPSGRAWSSSRPHNVGATRRPPPPDAQHTQSRRTGALGRQPPHLSEANAHLHFTVGRCQLAGVNYRAAWFLGHAYRRSCLRIWLRRQIRREKRPISSELNKPFLQYRVFCFRCYFQTGPGRGKAAAPLFVHDALRLPPKRNGPRELVLPTLAVNNWAGESSLCLQDMLRIVQGPLLLDVRQGRQ